MKSILLVIVLAYLGLGLFVYAIQRSLLYMPSPAFSHHVPVITLEGSAHQTEVLVANAGNEKAIFYFGGNAEHVVFSAGEIAQAFPEYTVYLTSYRGYGNSTGSPSERAVFEDALKLFDTVGKKHSSVSLIGRSLGSGVASYLASQRAVEKLVLVTPFDSIRSVAQKRMPVFPMRIMLKDHFDSMSRVPEIRAETLILTAELDAIIPASHSTTLAKAFPQNQIMTYMVKGADHNDLSVFADYYSVIRRFLLNEI